MAYIAYYQCVILLYIENVLYKNMLFYTKNIHLIFDKTYSGE